MNKDLPKPYLELGGRAILEHTVLRFLQVESVREVVIPTAAEYLPRARALMAPLADAYETVIRCVEGGSQRQYSIYNGLQSLGGVDLVAVHDAVRPFVKPGQILRCCEVAAEYGGAVLGVPAKDTIKRVDEERFILETPDRRFLWQTQTPQVFQKELLVRAYEQAEQDRFLGTDDASLVERLGEPVKMVEGDRDNFKITYPFDLELAGMLLAREN